MNKVFVSDKDLKGNDYSENFLQKGDYENCKFISCLFANSDLSDINFSDCEFENCDLSLVKLANTSLRGVNFKNCKLLGLHFEDCNKFLFAPNFDACHLNLSTFYRLVLKKTIFKDCSLREVDFVESDLQSSVFDNCDLLGAIFENTILEKADFRNSFNFSIDPEKNRIKKAKFSLTGIIGLLDKYDIEVE